MAKIPRFNCFGGASVINFSQTVYVNAFSTNTTTEAQRQMKIYEAVTLSKLEVIVSANTIATSPTTVRTRIATANGNMNISIAAGATGTFQDSSNTDTFNGTGQKFCFQIVTPGTSGSISIYAISHVVDTPSGTTNFYVQRNGVFAANNVTRFNPISGGALVETTEAITQTKMKVAGTFKNFNMYIISNARVVTDTFRFRVNNANSNPIITVTSGLTGFLEDASNTAVTAVDDFVDFSSVWGADGNQLSFGFMGAITFVTTVDKTMITQSNINGPINIGLTRYTALQGDGGVTATEAFVQNTALVAGIYSNLSCYVSANTVTAASSYKFRKNGGNGNQSVTITASTTGFFTDASNTDTVVATDTVNTMITTGATGTSMWAETAYVLFTLPALARPVIVNQAINRAANY
jgi:hypothetical protein